jgi:hypothetical protein
MKGLSRGSLWALAASTAVTLAFVGCGGDSGPTEVKFPDVSKLPPPPPVAKGKVDNSLQGPTSQGDPTEASRKK